MPVLEARRGLYVGQRTVETRAEARMTPSAAGIRNMQEGIMEERLSQGRCVGVRAEADGWRAATPAWH